MKKIIALLMAVVLIVTLCACGAGAATGTQTATPAAAETQTADPTQTAAETQSTNNADGGTTVTYSGNWRIISQPGESDVKVLNLPDVRQATGYTCGASSLQAVLFYYGYEYPEGVLAAYASSNEWSGTSPDCFEQAIEKVNAECSSNFTVQVKQGSTISDIEALIDQETPVIVDIQAWKDSDDTTAWTDTWENGHYVVVIGYDSDNLYLEDPLLINSIGVIPQDEFVDRWHDYMGSDAYDPATSETTNHLMVVIQGEDPYPVDVIMPLE